MCRFSRVATLWAVQHICIKTYGLCSHLQIDDISFWNDNCDAVAALSSSPPLPGKVSARRETKDRRPLLSTPTFHAAAAVDSQEGSNEGGGGRLTEMKMAEGWHLFRGGGADDHTIVFAAQK